MAIYRPKKPVTDSLETAVGRIAHCLEWYCTYLSRREGVRFVPFATTLDDDLEPELGHTSDSEMSKYEQEREAAFLNGHSADDRSPARYDINKPPKSPRRTKA